MSDPIYRGAGNRRCRLTRFIKSCFIVAVLISAGFSISSMAEAATGVPRIYVEENTHNWGKVLKGDVVEHVFRVRNDGDSPLLIEQVKAT